MDTGWLLARLLPMMMIRSVPIQSLSEQVGAPKPSVCLSPTVEAAWQSRAQRVDVRRARDAGQLLQHVIGLVGEPAAGDEHAHAVGLGRGQRARRPSRSPRPTRCARSRARRGGGAAGRARARAGAAPRWSARAGASMSPSAGSGMRAHGVEAQELEPREAEVDAGDHVVAQAARTERAAVADAVAQDSPGVAPAARGSPTRP